MIAGCIFLDSALSEEKAVPRKVFQTAEDAAKALVFAYDSGDQKAVAKILGDQGMRLVSSGDPVIDRHEREWFLSLYQEGHGVVLEGDDRAVLQLGKAEYPYPVPIVKEGTGWWFDPREGHEDLISRRISKAELSALNVVVVYLEAQREYYRQDHDGDGVLEYAGKFKSAPGQHDGLYWEGKTDDAASPIAGFADAFLEEGYQPAQGNNLTVYRGYFYKILKSQGARDYVVDGKMTEGFALVAFPIRYGISGVMTFLVNQDGIVYQNDLGPETLALGYALVAFDPDESWTKGQQN
jgi:hypothetical protein